MTWINYITKYVIIENSYLHNFIIFLNISVFNCFCLNKYSLGVQKHSKNLTDPNFWTVVYVWKKLLLFLQFNLVLLWTFNLCTDLSRCPYLKVNRNVYFRFLSFSSILKINGCVDELQLKCRPFSSDSSFSTHFWVCLLCSILCRSARPHTNTA